MFFKYLMTILLSSGVFMSGFSQYSVKVIVLNVSDKHLILNANFVVRKQGLVQKTGSLPTGGRLEVKGLTAGRFSLSLTGIGYVDYSAEFDLSSGNPVFDFGKITLLEKRNLLEEVRIFAPLHPIRIKGDTTEYQAGAFKSNPNDKVENLLKQLPGISVGKDGKLSAQGQTITRVLVDGAEFFGDDPTLATRNIRADMVDKIQVFEQKTELATLSRVNDGKGIRTLNVTLKADKKNGYFGKVEVGKGTDGYYGGQLMLNSFSGQQRISVYGVSGNNGSTSLNWQDNAKYASSSVDLSVPGYQIDSGGYDELESRSGHYSGQGIPVARTSGLHYENKWSKNENSIIFNYKIGSLTSTGEQRISSQNSLPSGLVNTISDQQFSKEVFRQKLDGQLDFKLDSSANLKITMNGGVKDIAARNSDVSRAIVVGDNDESPDDHISKRTENERFSTESIKLQQFTLAALYLKKLKKKGRTYTAGLRSTVEQHQMDGRLNSSTMVSQMGLVNQQERIDQDKTARVSNKGLYTNVSYSEPLSKSLLLLANYGLGISDNGISRYSFNLLEEHNPAIPDALYSNDFDLKQFSQEVGLNFNLAKDKVVLNFGSKLAALTSEQRDRFAENGSERRFLLWNPQLNFQYTLSPQSNIRFNYEGSAAVPAIAKLQPVLINDDPLNITQGNPSLKPSFSNRFFVGYQSYNAENGQLIGVFANYGRISNPVVNKMQTDTVGKTFTQFTNLSDQQSSSLNLSLFYDRKVKSLDMTAGLNFNVNGNTNYNLSNDSLNRLHDYTYKLQMRFSKLVPNVYDVNLSFGPGYTVSGSSLQPDYPNNGKVFLVDGDFTLYLPLKFQMTATAAYQYLGKTAAFNERLSRLMLNASISKMLMKENALKFSLSGSDLLNQNVGFNRSISGNLISQRSFTVIKRYFMLSATYDLNKMTPGPGK